MSHTIQSLISSDRFPKKPALFSLLPFFTGLSREQFTTKPETTITDEQYETLQAAYDDLTIRHRPLEYIVGGAYFDGRRFVLDDNVLIPRPETEYMIEAISEQAIPDSILVDVGTGSGVLGISGLINFPNKFPRAYLSEISPHALTVAKNNASRLLDTSLQAKITWIEGSLLDWAGKVTLVANLPYIPDETFEQDADQNVKDREPHLALLGGKDGLDLYRLMIDQLLTHSRDVVGLREMMTRQIELLQAEYPMLHFEAIKTFHANIRILKVHKPL